jgi:hypothetical protein
MLLFYRIELTDIFSKKTPYEEELGDLMMKQFKRLFML